MKKCLRCEALFASESWTCPSCGSSPATADGVTLFAPDLAGGIAGYAPELFATHGGDQADGSFWTPARAALIEWALHRFAPRAGRFLEVGCGTGGVLARLEAACPELELSGAEALLGGLTAASRRLTRTRLMQLDAAHLPFDGEFDAVGAFDVIEHIQDESPVLSAMARALRPGGALLLTVPQHPFLYGPADEAARHVRRYTAAGLIAQVRQLGLRVECVTSFVSLLFPAMAGVRLAARWRGGSYDSAEEFAIGPLNRLFGTIMDVERWTIRHGMRWPFGGSLLLVARKSPA